jgi:predicted helicase
LLPRIYGFELMMASYSVAHMKIGMYLKSLGYKFEKEQRLNIFLTNSLEPYTANNSANLFFTSVGAESAGANEVKQNRYFSVVIGNPPYSGISKNNDPWISNLVEDYKYIDGEHFNEKKHWLNDDYVKFVRLGEYLIEKNSVGVLAFINPHGFLDNPTFRGMRWHLLKTFNNIHAIDLHGNSNKKEKSPDGSVDTNVFDIQQGVSINIFSKTNKGLNNWSEIFHFDLYGKREFKYDYLKNNSLRNIQFSKLNPVKPKLFFIPTNNENLESFNTGFKLDELMPKYITGIMTAADPFIINMSKDDLISTLKDFFKINYTENEIRVKYNLGKNYAGWVLQNKSKTKFDEKKIVKLTHRPFDDKWTYYDNNFLWRSRNQIMYNYFNKENIGLITAKSNKTDKVDHFFISKFMLINLVCFPLVKTKKSKYYMHF